MTRNGVFINQIDLIAGIADHLRSKGVKNVTQQQFNSIIKAADSILAAFETPPSEACDLGVEEHWDEPEAKR